MVAVYSGGGGDEGVGVMGGVGVDGGGGTGDTKMVESGQGLPNILYNFFLLLTIPYRITPMLSYLTVKRQTALLVGVAPFCLFFCVLCRRLSHPEFHVHV